jgi:hypothetical protein
MLAARPDTRRDRQRDKERAMNTAVRWAATLVLFMLISGLQLHLNDAAATPGPVNPGRLSPFVAECANTDDAGQHGADIVVMGPGGDFAGATVIHVAAAKPASTGILVLGPGGDFAGATVAEPTSAELVATDHVVFGPGGDFAGATVIHVDMPAASDGLATDGTQSTCG